jgi:hypothetical protein
MGRCPNFPFKQFHMGGVKFVRLTQQLEQAL